MQYRTDPKSGNALSALGFGCMRFPRSFEKTEALIVKAVERGVNYFDTAYLYFNSEETLGRILEKNKLRDQVYLATKLPIAITRSAADFDKFFERQLARLRTESIDYYLIHMLTSMGSWERLRRWGIEDWIREKKASGKIRRIGFSFHGTQNEFLELLDAYNWEFCQIQYNYADENFQAGVTGLKKAAAKGLPVIVMEPLLGGKLANGLPADAVRLFKQVDSARSPAAWALRWLWDQPAVTVILSGMNADEQLEDNLRTAETMTANALTDTERATFAAVRKIFDQSFKIKCTGCNYCMPCPHGVNIPACFAAYNGYYAMGWRTGMQQYVTSTGGIAVTQHFAGQCKKCGKCERLCPQSLPIIRSLELVRKKLEFPGMKGILSIVRRVLNLRVK